MNKNDAIPAIIAALLGQQSCPGDYTKGLLISLLSTLMILFVVILVKEIKKRRKK